MAAHVLMQFEQNDWFIMPMWRGDRLSFSSIDTNIHDATDVPATAKSGILLWLWMLQIEIKEWEGVKSKRKQI